MRSGEIAASHRLWRPFPSFLLGELPKQILV
jgi:hypothetical protein